MCKNATFFLPILDSNFAIVPTSPPPPAVSEVLRTLIAVYKEIFKAPTLTDVVLLQNYPQTILTIDEVCKEGLPEHMDKASILKTLAFKLPTFTGDAVDKGKNSSGGILGRRLATTSRD